MIFAGYDRRHLLPVRDQRRSYRGNVGAFPLPSISACEREGKPEPATKSFTVHDTATSPRVREDIEMTREIKAAAETLGIAIHDHLVIGRKVHASFRSLGLV